MNDYDPSELLDMLMGALVLISGWFGRTLWTRQTELQAMIMDAQRDLDDRSQARHNDLRNILEKQHDDTMNMMLDHQRNDHNGG